MLKIQLLGHLGNDAVVKQLQDGSSVINFSVAHSEKYKDRSGIQKEITTWCSCSMFFKPEKEPKVAEYLKKGQNVWIAGTPSANAYITQNGKAASELKIRVDSLLPVGKAKDTGQNFANEVSGYPLADLPY